MSIPTHNPSLTQRRLRRNAAGFTLTEVMVALIIIAIGMFGIAKMQALALSSTSGSRSRALAAIEASSLAAAMHANRAFWASAATAPGVITVTTVPGGGVITPTSTSGAMGAALTAAAGNICATTGASGTMNANLSCLCTAACNANTYMNLAASDVVDWGNTLNVLLPNAKATVTCNSALNPVDCIINISWVEAAVALNTQEAAAASANSNSTAATTAAAQYVTYNLYVVP